MSKANNNRKNKRSFLEYQKRLQELASMTEDEARKNRIMSNMDLWYEMIPLQYRNATPDKLHPKTIEKIKKTSLKPPFDKFIIITSKDATTSMFTGYTIIHALLQRGFMNPGEVKISSIMDSYSNIHGMFNSRDWKENFFSKKGQVLIINGASKSLTKLGSKGEEQFWRELIEHCINNDRLVIITYITDETENNQEVFIPAISSIKELNTAIIRKSMFITLTDDEEREIENEQKRFFESL